MIIVGICGSPRKQATEHVLKDALMMLSEQGFETRFFTVRGKHIEFCTHCDYCLEHKECVFKDDMQEVYSLLEESKGIIFATPVYNGGISAQTKAIMDRCRAVAASDRNFFKHKVGMGIALGGDRVTFYVLNGIVPISGGFFGANLGATFWTKDTLEGAKQDEEGFRSLRKTIKKFSAFLNTQQ
jgi:multimeric flavodoxin WrbA